MKAPALPTPEFRSAVYERAIRDCVLARPADRALVFDQAAPRLAPPGFDPIAQQGKIS